MVKEIIELEFKNTGERYYFSSYRGIYANFSSEEVGITLESLYRKKIDEKKVKETKYAFIRLIEMGGVKDIIRKEVKPFSYPDLLDAYNFGDIKKCRGVNPIVEGLNLLKRFDSPETPFGISIIGGTILITNMFLSALAEKGFGCYELIKMVSLGWKLVKVESNCEYWAYGTRAEDI